MYKLQFSSEQLQNMFDDYVNRIPVNEILQKYDVSYNTFKYLRKKYQISARPPVVEEDVAKAVEEFTNGTPLLKTAAKYGISTPTIYRYMKQHNIVYRNGHGRKHHFNEQYFQDIDDEHKAYWLGFLYADGSVTTTDKSCTAPNRLTINISAKDIDIIKMFLKDVGGDDIDIDVYDPDPRTYGTTPMARINLNSKALCTDLIRYGCVPNKTFKVDVPPIPMSLMPHFVRGLFDGDGNITGGNSPAFRITGYDVFLAQIKTYLNFACDLNSNANLRYYPKKDPRVCDLNFGGKNIVAKIYHHLYDDANIYLERKYKKFKDLLNL